MRALGYIALSPLAVVWFASVVVRYPLMLPWAIASGRGDAKAQNALARMIFWPVDPGDDWLAA